jgi:hypothetical protein
VRPALRLVLRERELWKRGQSGAGAAHGGAGRGRRDGHDHGQRVGRQGVRRLRPDADAAVRLQQPELRTEPELLRGLRGADGRAPVLALRGKGRDLTMAKNWSAAVYAFGALAWMHEAFKAQDGRR